LSRRSCIPGIIDVKDNVRVEVLVIARPGAAEPG